MAKVIVNIMPKTEILDPQGQAIMRALTRLGVDKVRDVRQGKRFELDVAEDISADQLEEIAETLLANTVIEQFVVERVEEK